MSLNKFSKKKYNLKENIFIYIDMSKKRIKICVKIVKKIVKNFYIFYYFIKILQNLFHYTKLTNLFI